MPANHLLISRSDVPWPGNTYGIQQKNTNNAINLSGTRLASLILVTSATT